MEVFHGTIYTFEEPKIKTSKKKTSDFGRGFYASTSLEQAENWAKKKMNKHHVSTAHINVYEFVVKPSDNLKIKTFDNIDEWMDFVNNNRTNLEFKHNYDIVYGKVADDDIYQSFSLYESGVISRETLKTNLLTKQDIIVDQYSFHTPKALKTLKLKRKIDICKGIA